MNTLPITRLSLLCSSVILAGAIGGMSGCTLSGRGESQAYYQQPDQGYQQPRQEYRSQPVVVRERREIRTPASEAFERLDQANNAVAAGDLNASKDSLRSARDVLRNAPRDGGTDAALRSIDQALDAANHTRPRITQDYISEAENALRDSRRYEAYDR